VSGEFLGLSAMDEPAESSVGALVPSAGLRRALMARDDEEQGTHVTDLPAVVLGSVLAHLEDPVDVMSALCTCRLFWFLVRTAPFRLCLRHRQFDETPAANGEDAPPTSVRVPPQTAGSWTRAALGSIRTHMCATRELDLAGCFILDEDVAAILANLRCLERLILDNCQKLTSAVADVLAASVKSGSSSVSLQRCFGLGASSIGNLLVASAADGSRMRSMLLSHLDSLEIPQNDPDAHTRNYECEGELTRGDGDIAKSLGSMSIGSGLRILALNNCARLAISDFISVAVLCPCLELLFLGGSVQALGSSRGEAVSQDTISSTASTLVRIIELLPRLRVLELTFFTSAVVQAVREQCKEKIQIWDFYEESSVAAAAWVLDGLKNPGSAGNGKLAALLDFPQKEDRWSSLMEDVAFGLRGAANCSDGRKRTPMHVAAARGDVIMIAGLLAIGAVAVGMKDSSGSTALFVAAESGYAQACGLLLRGGADVLASNRAGETPLYIAALRGHSAAVGIMLAYCHERGVNWQDADVYGDGWTPLMAAAVADRRQVGEMLLGAAGFESGLGFTQTEQHLMALGSTGFQEVDTLKDPDVAVTDYYHATGVILPTSLKPVQSNGKSETISCVEKAEDLNAGSTSQQLRRLLNRQNRYGQTALHIAAQKGSVWFIERLLRAGASLDVPNDYGYRAVDVAKRYKHTVIADILREWESGQRKEAPGSGGKKSSRKARRNKDKATRVATPDAVAPNPDCREADEIAVDAHNIDHPRLDEVIQSPAFVPDQQDPADSVTD
jgi:ankyrin repeat protein